MQEYDFDRANIIPGRVGAGFPRFRPPWGIKEILIVLLLVFLAGFTFQFFSTRLLERVLFFFPGPGGSERAAFFAAGLVQSLFFIGPVLAVVCGKYRLSLSTLGLGRCSVKDFLLMGVLGGLGLFLLVTGAMILLINIINNYPQPQPLAELIMESRNLNDLLGPLFLGGILAPLSEELYFRGFVYPVFRRLCGVFPAVLISACFFAALHFDPLRFLPLALGGVGLALLCEKTGSLIPSIAAHSAWNITMTLIVFFAGAYV